MKKKAKSSEAVVPEVVNGGTYVELVDSIGGLLARARSKIAAVANFELVKTYWQIGEYIVEYEQRGHDRARYGENLINRLSRDLTDREGKGFSKTNLLYMRKLYLTFRKGETLSHFLKRDEVEHYDIGQMNLYLNYFKEEVNEPRHGAPIGIVLGADKDDLLVHYATMGITNKLFVGRFKLFLPDKEQLRRELARAIEEEARRVKATKPRKRLSKKKGGS